jgi:ribonucleoside-diphosphate reductase alpha chain
MAKFDWYNETSKEFLDRGYLNNKTIYDRIDAIADTVYHVFNDTEIKDKVKEYIELGYYVLPSPVWANVGTKKAAGISCFNSYIEDSIKSILHTAAEVGMLCKIGGGTSAYFGSIRPAGSPISVGGTTYGAVHFMKIFDVIKNTISQGSCYIEGTQVLTNNGFKDFRDVNKNIDLLAQVDQYNNTTFTNQYELVVNDYTGELYCLSGKKRHNLLNLKVTPNHRMVVEKCKGDKRFKNKRWAGYTEIVTAEELKLHRDNRIPINTNIIGNKHLSFEDMLRIAYQADGRKNKPSHKLSFHFSKQRKIQRLTWILDNLKLDYTSYITKQGTTRIDVENALKFKIKNFSEWIDLSKIDSQWGSEFINELSYWDGSKKPKCILYSSCDYSNIEYAQAIASISNYKTSLNIRKKAGKQDLYRLTFSNIKSTSGESLSISKEQYNGKVYCAIVPNGRLIVKYNDTVSVCGNTRRGEFAAYLDISHGDIEDFIRINQEGHPLQRFPFGVCVSDDWLESMKNGDAQKRKIWAGVLEARCKTGFPYIMFSDTVNNNTVDVYKDKGMRIYSSNMCCVAGDQKVVTSKGIFTAKQLYNNGKQLQLFDGYNIVKSSPMNLIKKDDVYQITLSNGMKHKITKEHKIKVLSSSGSYEMVECQNLKLGQRVFIQENKGLFGDKHMPDEAFLLGMYHGDGTQNKTDIMLDVWENDFDLIPKIQKVFNKIHKKYNCDKYDIKNKVGVTIGSRSRKSAVFHDCIVRKGSHKKKRLSSRTLYKSLNFQKYIIPDWIWQGTEKTQWEYIKGLLYTDGSAHQEKNKETGNPLYISYSSINKEWLEDIQILLLNLGIRSSLSLQKKGGKKLLPNGKGGMSYYNTKNCWRLVIRSKSSGQIIEKNTKFLSRKGIKLENKLYRDNSKKHFSIKDIKHIGKEDVYCVNVKTEDHLWVCNGFITHNSEILLPTNAEETFVCDLIGMNLTKYDEWKNTDAVRIATYIADAVLEEFIEMYENEDLIKRSVNFAKRHRALGIGASGYHSLLQSKMIPFESMEAKFLNLEIFKHIQDNAWEASKELAQRYGSPELLRDYGRRNTTLTAVAPNTSSSMIMGQHSQSIEPYTANYYIKKSAKKKLSVKNPYLEKVLDEKNKNTLEIWESILIKGGSVQHLDFLSEQEKKIFRTFGEISQKEILIQAAQRQKYIDQGQSLNLMIHPNTPIKDINKLMLEAHGMGIKTLYYQLSTNAAQEFIRDILSCDNCAG